MKWLTPAAIICVALATAATAAEPTFTASLSSAELEAAGIANLTPAQRAQLDSLAEKFRSGALAEARRVADSALREKQLAEAQAARAEANAAAARAEATKAQEAAAAQAAVVRAEKSRKAGPKAEPVTIESTIPGKFRGWRPQSVFVLANGQRWQVANAESFYAPETENPRVQIRPAALTGYWMWFPDLRTEVRVKLLSDE